MKYKIVFNKKIICFGVLLIALGLAYINLNRPGIVFVNEDPLALVTSESVVKSAIDKAKEELAREYGLALTGFKNELSYDTRSRKSTNTPVREEELVSLLKDRLDWQVNSYALSINGNNVLYLADENAAQTTLDEIKRKYLSEEAFEFTLENIEFAEKVAITQAESLLKEVRTTEQAVDVLIRGQDKSDQYIVKKGETLWTIARDNNMSLSQLQEANPEIKGDLLSIGQNINLVTVEPLVTVVYILTTTIKEEVPYPTIYENDPNLYRSQQKIKQAGVNGSRQATYRITKANGLETDRQTLAEEMLSEPLIQILIRGTKSMVVASRGGEWAEKLKWPLRGPITSGYGYRGKEFHAAIDLDGVTGDPVCAAADGIVTFAGWSGNLGNIVAVDHGTGLVTRYAHLSGIEVSVDQKVSGGSVIGKVGSTGRSTGSHLHFEVWVNGKAQNPLRFLEG